MRVFVYGTLKQGHYNHSVMERAMGEFISEDSIADGMFTMWDLGAYPALELSSLAHTSVIHGEVYEVPEEGIPVLDRLEGYPNLYNRMEVELLSGETALVYFMTSVNLKYATRIPEGNWSN